MEMSGRRKQKSPRRLSEDVEPLSDDMNPDEKSSPDKSSYLCHLCKYEFSGPGQLAIHLRYVHQQIAELQPKNKRGPSEAAGSQGSSSGDQDTPTGEDTTTTAATSASSSVGGGAAADACFSPREKDSCNFEDHVTYNQQQLARRRTYIQSSMPDDRYIYCEECKERYEGECPLHPFTIIEDKRVPAECDNRARLTLPDFLSIATSSIEGVGEGVWAEKFIPKGVRFGPYAGEIVGNDAGYRSGYAWEICVQGRVLHCIDGKDECKGNWLRYVNCARSESEQNLVAFQYLGQIYYHSCKAIEPGTELLVYYGEEFAKKLDVISELTSLMFDSKSSTYKCEFCGRMYTIAIYLARHLRYSHNKVIKSSSAVHQAVKSIDRESIAAMVAESCQRSTPEPTQTESSTTENGESHSQYPSFEQRSSSHTNESQGSNVFDTQCHRLSQGEGYILGSGEPMLDLGLTGSQELRRDDVGDGRNPGEDRQGENEGKEYECGVCGQQFALELVYNAHMITHSVVDGHRCDMCGDLFPTREDLDAHACIQGGRVEENGNSQASEDKHKPFQCSVCAKRFGQKEYLRTHMRIHTGEKPYHCRFCDKAFAQGSARNTHERTHTKMRPFVCDVPSCGMRFRDGSHLRTHKRIHMDAKPFQCRFCGKCFLFASQLTQHELTHSTLKPYVCGVCNRGFNQKAYLRVHERLHTGERPYACRMCGKRFNQMTSRNVHEQKHGNWGMYNCHKCGLSFKRSRDLLGHECYGVTMLNGTPPPMPQPVQTAQPLQRQIFPCKQCPLLFASSSELHKHQKTHVLRPFSCNICSKRFTHRSYLEIHVRIHTGEKPYSCKYCGKTFSQTSSRNAHERIHERIKAAKQAEQSVTEQQEAVRKTNENVAMPNLPMQPAIQTCRFCNKTFTDVALLISHEQSHMRPRDHICGFCGKAFSKGRYLQIHERTHTGEKPYQCRYCTKRFTQGSSRNVHERIHVRNGDYKMSPLSPINQLPPPSPTHVPLQQTIPPFSAQSQQQGNQSVAQTFNCRYCGLQFTDAASVEHHEKVHGIRPFICNICGRTFTQSRYLQIHVRTHVGEQPYPCRFCNKRFSQCSARNMHERVHTEFRPHECPICGKSFIVNSALQKHLQKHQFMANIQIPGNTPTTQHSLISL
ncbi:uncharacterized protein [Diadema setosum]|uniref:uncharacterized protein n=1 Tax=Diadema setosum TaxID=31175 RepID=UPI003B3AA256